MAESKRSFAPLIALVLVFALPPVLGWLYYLNPGLIPGTGRNHGTLISPPRAVDGLRLTTPEGGAFDWSRLDDRWTFAVVTTQACEARCRALQDTVHRLRRAQPAGDRRINLLLIAPEGSAPQLAPNLFLLALWPAAARVELAHAFQLTEADPQYNFFIIDSTRRLMMRHDLRQSTPKEMLADVKVLLEARSQQGVTVK